MIKKLFQKCTISILLILYIMILPATAHAYLVPLVAGAGWLIAVIFGGVAVVATFIWLHVKKISLMIKSKNKNKENTQDQDIVIDDNADQD